jgi:RNA polymerase sigma-70 factor (ECF subfamily)
MVDWEAILAHEGPAVWRTLWRLLGDRADADECFQETFLSALRFSRAQVVLHWSALLQRLATARAVDLLRRRYRLREALGESAGESDVEAAISDRPGPVELAAASELSERLRRALARLSQEQAEIFSLHALSGWSYEEIGRQMGMSSSNVGVTLHRARHRLGDPNNAGKLDAATTQWMSSVGAMTPFLMSLPKDEYAYLGSGVNLNQKDTIIFWYQNQETKKYRAIYANLTAKDVEDAKVLPKAKANVAPPAGVSATMVK